MNPTPGRGSTPAPGRHHLRLVGHLVRLKERSGCSYARLASNSHTTGGTDGTGSVSATTLKRVVDLTKDVPVERAVTAYVRACGVGGEEEALRLWRTARREPRPSRRSAGAARGRHPYPGRPGRGPSRRL